ncbi:hypothetical protein ACFSN5_04620 [Streptococcus tangpeifui]|uniref:hypothetical protein n=1 Tax=Streptococcus tangpeifui TaxID=2709400 RepID=UPI0013E9AD8A|nr:MULTISPECIES: hypothetical protein [unclassified Streptococcus]
MPLLKKYLKQHGGEILDQTWLAFTFQELQAMGYGQDVPESLVGQIPEIPRREAYAN